VPSSTGARVGVLAGVALLALAVALVFSPLLRHKAKSSSATPWYTALAAPNAPSTGTKTSACGVKIGPDTLGVGHPRLPCGVKIVLEVHGKQVPTTVIDRGATTPGHDFDLTRALARRLGLQGVQTIQWRFAR